MLGVETNMLMGQRPEIPKERVTRGAFTPIGTCCRSTDPTPVESNAEKTAVDMPTATAPTEPVASQDARQSQDVRQDPMAQKPLPKTGTDITTTNSTCICNIVT